MNHKDLTDEQLIKLLFIRPVNPAVLHYTQQHRQKAFALFLQLEQEQRNRFWRQNETNK